jgi:serine/threonine protein phosphatase PrpC
MPTRPAEPVNQPHGHQIDVCGLTHPGLVRSENQDHFLIATLHKSMRVIQTSMPEEALGDLRSPSRGYVFLVADGVGGTPGGRDASRTALRAIVDYVLSAMDLYQQLDEEIEPEFEAELRRSVELSHEAVRQAGDADEDRAGMATTLTMVCFRWPKAYIVHVGDSRGYRLRNDQLELLTKDQTMAQAMIDAGALSPEQAARSRLNHILYSAIGATRAEPYSVTTDAQWDDRMLICTDGITKHITDAEIRDALRGMKTAEATARELLQLALDRGGSDNTTLIVGRLHRN